MSSGMGEIESSDDDRPRRGLGIASVAIGAAGLTLAVATWAAWVLIRPRIVSEWPFSWVSQAFLLVLGALWFALLPLGALGLVFAGYSGVRAITGPGRIGAGLAAVTLLLALLGAAVFATTSFARVGPPVAYFDSTTGR